MSRKLNAAFILIAILVAFNFAHSHSAGEPPANGKSTKSKNTQPQRKPSPKPSKKRGAPSDDQTINWPSFRGPNASGLAIGCKPPQKWDATTGENILWKTKIPGLGHSCPVIWGDRVFVTTAVSGMDDPELKVGLYGDIQSVNDDTEHEFRVLCLDKDTGKVLWNKLAYKGVPKVKRHTKATHANCTPATDGKHIVAFFASEGLYCYDFDGKLKWKKDLGTLDSGFFRMPQAQWEFASSPVIHDGRVLLQCDIQGGGFVTALDVKTGKELWRTPRKDECTWSTPTVFTYKMTDAPKKKSKRTTVEKYVILNGWKHIGAYDFKTGKEVWKMTGGGDIPVPTPVIWNDLVFIANAHGQWGPLFAVKAASKGDISLSLENGETSNDHIAWCDPKSYAYMQTPIVVGDIVYNCRDNGGLTCYKAEDGEQVYQERIGGGSTGFTASPVAALFGPDKNPASKARIYYSSEEGDVFVIKPGREFKVLATNPLGEVCMATPAISGDAIYFRTQGHVVAVGERSK